MILELDHVKKEYPQFELDCSLKLHPGCVTGLIGQNGAGKSTTFKAILDLIRIDSGSIKIFGKDYRKLGKTDKEDIGVALSDAGFSEYLTIRKVVPVMKSLYHRFDRQDFLDKCMHFELPIDKKIKDFSTGMYAKLKLLIAMSHDAKLLILDEPAAGLDVLAREELLDMLRGYMENESRSILISSHISGVLEHFCDDIYMIHRGQIVMHEDTDTLLEQYAILKVNPEEYQILDKDYLLRIREESYGYCCLTDQRQYYQENYPQIVIEKGSIDQTLMMMARGDRI